DQEALARRRAKGDVQHRALFGGVDLVAAKHGVDTFAYSAGFRKRLQQAKRFVGDAVLRKIQVEPGRFRDKPLATRSICRKELAQMPVLDLPAMLGKRAPL